MLKYTVICVMIFCYRCFGWLLVITGMLIKKVIESMILDRIGWWRRRFCYCFGWLVLLDKFVSWQPAPFWAFKFYLPGSPYLKNINWNYTD
jgi:hypothetical protein